MNKSNYYKNTNELCSRIKVLENTIEEDLLYKDTNNIEIVKEASKELKSVLKEITQDNIDYDSRYGKALKELFTIDEQLEDCDEIDFQKYTYCLALITDVSNNIAHDSKNNGVKQEMFSLKSKAIENMEKEIHKNRNEMDIISGYQFDWSSGSQVPVYIVDIPGIGQVSWHTTLKSKGALDKIGIEEYPYKIEKGGEFVSDLLLYNTKQKPKDIPHNYIVQMVPEGEENTLRLALDLFEMYKGKSNTDEGREIIIKRLGRETYLSEEMLETLSDMLDVSYKQVKKEREENLKESKEVEEKRMDYKQLKNEKAISQVNQFIMSISKESQEKIPADLRRFFKENDTHKKEYELDFEHFDESELEEETKAFFCIISKYLKDIDYQEIKPSWKKLEIEGKNKEAIKQLDLELATNFFNISNYYSERELTKVEFIYNIRFFGRSMDIKKSNKLEPFRALCNVFCILHQKYSNTENFDYNEALNQYKYVEHELRNLL